MKTPVAVTLIIMGALLVVTPALSDFAYQRNVIALMSRADVSSVVLAGQMTEIYRFGCWLTGSAMIGVAVLASMFARTRELPRGDLAARAA